MQQPQPRQRGQEHPCVELHRPLPEAVPVDDARAVPGVEDVAAGYRPPRPTRAPAAPGPALPPPPPPRPPRPPPRRTPPAAPTPAHLSRPSPTSQKKRPCP